MPPVVGLLLLALTVSAPDGVARAAVDQPRPVPPGHAGPPAPLSGTGGGTDAAGQVAVVAHRGASAARPENTLGAVRLAVEKDSDMVEVDVRQTKDDELVAMHDATLARTTNVETVFPERAPYRVADFTLAEIRTLDAGSWKGEEHAGQRVPTLAEVIDVLSGTGVGLMLEAKQPERYPDLGERITEVLRRSHLRNRSTSRELTVASFDWDFQREFARHAPGYAVGVIGTPQPDDLGGLARWAELVNPKHQELDEKLVDQIHDAGMQTYTWTVDEPKAMRRMIRYGVDGIITNKPGVLSRQLRKLRTHHRADTGGDGDEQPRDARPATPVSGAHDAAGHDGGEPGDGRPEDQPPEEEPGDQSPEERPPEERPPEERPPEEGPPEGQESEDGHTDEPPADDGSAGQDEGCPPRRDLTEKVEELRERLRDATRRVQEPPRGRRAENTGPGDTEDAGDTEDGTPQGPGEPEPTAGHDRTARSESEPAVPHHDRAGPRAEPPPVPG